MSELYPVYIVLFSNNTKFAKMIERTTGQQYSHAVLSLDSTLNNMYSFSDIPFNHKGLAGFVRESIWSPMYSKNKFFTVLVTFTDKNGINKINDRIEEFRQNYTRMKYNDLGLIKYYLNFKDTKDRSISKKQKWFCSEFVTYILKTGDVKGFEDILQSPQDLKTLTPTAINLGDFTIPTFNEADLKRRTAAAKKVFISQNMMEVPEAATESKVQITTEAIIQFIKSDKTKYKENEIVKYVALLDWKALYDKFTELFKYTKPEIRFPLIELIIRRYFIPFKVSAINVTDKLIAEMEAIHSKMKGRVINFIDVENSKLFVYINKNIVPLFYPDSFKDTDK